MTPDERDLAEERGHVMHLCRRLLRYTDDFGCCEVCGMGIDEDEDVDPMLVDDQHLGGGER